ncbi:membrane protein [Hypericibacter adhaerens]|uniref:Membrane protein n=1 Tax=Hypericibacter adhaerens TaxID=2602016 RepID=A0A5J6N145_9PROT|nr:MMPL family transporter [Hypericibacter adhaerens]QEX22994.1 membrane protein [Hypericibacter adhaerens]
MRAAALFWLLLVLAAALYLGWRLHEGLRFRTDLLALLPREAQDADAQHANDVVTAALSRQVMIMVGGPDRDQTRAAATAIAAALTQPKLMELTTDSFGKDRLRRIGELYFPYRRGLLSAQDRQSLLEGKPEAVSLRALSQIYGLVGMADAKLLQRDPYLLLPDFLTHLPVPLSRLSLDDGLLALRDGGDYWILLAGQITGDPYALAFQAAFGDALDDAVAAQRQAHADLQVLRLGAVFFAKAGAEQAMGETSTIGLVSVLGTVLLVLAIFRAVRPLGLTLVAIGTGVLVSLSACLLLFGELHVLALLFGVSLIGVAVDYSLQYLSEIFALEGGAPRERLRRVWLGITLATATVAIGYLTMFLAPFPGLHQIAALAAIGLAASWATVMLWLPALDHSRRPRHGERVLSWAGAFLGWWLRPRSPWWGWGGAALLLLIAVGGWVRFHPDDDVRRMQSLSGPLMAEQDRIQQLTGATGGTQFFLVEAADDESALQTEEALIDRLGPLLAEGALAGFQAPAQYVPSAARQRQNRELVHRELDGPLLAQHLGQLGLDQLEPPPAEDAAFLTLDQAVAKEGALGFLGSLLLTGGKGALHVVKLDGVARPDALAGAAQGLAGVRLIDPAGDFSQLLAKYRHRALGLLALSAALMTPLLIWRYGWKTAPRVIAPPLLAVLLAPALRAWFGASFTFFDGMALVLVLSVGVDYSIFLAETSAQRQRVTMLAVAMAAATALLSFGLLALSSVQAVHAFGTTMLIGILLAFLFSPLARTARPRPEPSR